jgi:hypothetical protein
LIGFRPEKWFDVLIEGSDGALDAATKDMEKAVNELSQAVGLATLKTVEILDKVIQSMNGKVEFLVSQSTIIVERTEAIQSNTSIIIEQNQDVGHKQDVMMEIQRETLEKLTEQSQMFSDAVDRFESVQMGQNFGENFQTSLLKLDVVMLRLTRWGHSVGLANFNDVNSLSQTKISPEDIPQVENLLSQILDLFADAEKVSNRFQKRTGNSSATVLDPAKELDKVQATLHQKMNDLAKKRQGKTESLQTTKWTLYEEKNFTRLIEDISELVDGMVDLFPGTQEEQRKLCEEEVSEMNKTQEVMPLLKEIAAGQDKLLSEVVVRVIESSSTSYSNSVIFSGPNSGFQIGNNSGKISNVRWGGSA